jgi:hypothetical protein
LSWAHCTHATTSWTVPQIGVGAAQSVFTLHATQRPRGPQTFVAVAAQSALVAHCTQVDSDALHFGAVAGH